MADDIDSEPSGTEADGAPRAVERARDGSRLTAQELTALFAERRP